jgi:gluconolactonase
VIAAAPRAFADWEPSQRYPDQAIKIVDQSFARYRLALSRVERLGTGFRWREGPVWFGDGRYLLWSDIPNNRIMRWDEETGAVSVYRVDGRSGKIDAVAGDLNRPNGLCFSPDESKLYVVEGGVPPRIIQAFDVVEGGTRLAKKRPLINSGQGTPDGMRCDVDGNLWMGWGLGQEGLDGVSVFNPDSKLIGRIDLPARCANVCFGGAQRNRLFMCGSTAIYALYVNTQGAIGG